MDALIVDDEELMTDLLETVVAGLHPAMEVHKAYSVAQALECWQRRQPDFLIVDWNLPDGSGLDILRQIRAENQNVPVVMITGRTDRDSILKAAHYGISGYISKPFRIEMLHQRLLDMVGHILPEEKPVSLQELLAQGLETVIQVPTSTDVNAILELMERKNELSVAELAERWRSDASLCSRLLDVANHFSFRRTGKAVTTVRDAITAMGVPMALNQGLALALDVSASFSSDILRSRAAEYQALAASVATEVQKVARALGKVSPSFYTAGLLSRMGELAVLKVMDHYLREGGSLTDDEVQKGIQDWAQPYGNRLKVQWCLPLELRQLIGAVHYLSRENVMQDHLIMRAGALLAGGEGDGSECRRLLRQLGLEEWQAGTVREQQKHEEGTDE